MLQLHRKTQLLAHLFQIGLHQANVPVRRDLDLADEHEVVARAIAIEIDDVDVLAGQVLAEAADDAGLIAAEGADDEAVAKAP